MIRKRDRVVDAQPAARRGMHRPAGHAETHHIPQPGQPPLSVSARRRHHHMTRQVMAGIQMTIAQVDAALAIHAAHRIHGRMLQNLEAGQGENAGHFLTFAKRIGFDHRHAFIGQRSAHEVAQLGNRLGSGREPVARVAEGALDDEHIGPRQFGPLAGGRLAEFEVAGIEQCLIVFLDMEHGRAEAVASRIGRELERAPGERLAIGQVARRARTHAMLIQLRGRGSAKREPMPSHMIAVSMRDKAVGLAAAEVDRQAGAREFQAAIVVKHRGIASERA